MTNVAEQIFSQLKRSGVTHVFYVPGGGAMYLVDALGRSGITPISCLHEQGAAYAAVGYAEATGGLGVCLTTAGPGVTNALSGCACAWLESAPVLFISGQAPIANLSGNNNGVRSSGVQEVPTVEIVSPIVKRARMLREGDDPCSVIDSLQQLALSSRPGPVWLDVPLNVQSSLTTSAPLLPSLPGTYDAADYHHLATKLLSALHSSHRPVLLLGNGARCDRASVFSQILGIPTLTTWKAMDLLPEDNSLYCGRPGRIGHPAANQIIDECDLLISIGARLDYLQTGFDRDKFAPNATLLQFDVDPRELHKLPVSTHRQRYYCDGPRLIDAVLQANTDSHSLFDTIWSYSTPDWLSHATNLYSCTARPSLSPFAPVVSLLSAVSPAGQTIVIGGAGQAVESVFQQWQVKPCQRILSSPSFGAMGTGIPASLGAALATGRPVTCIIGDGGFHLNSQELQTIQSLDLPIHIFVCSDRAYGSIRTMQDRWFNGRHYGCDHSSGLTLPSAARVAESYGMATNHLSLRDSSSASLKHILRLRPPTVCEVTL